MFITSTKGSNEKWFKELSRFIQGVEYVGTYTQGTTPRFGTLIQNLYQSLKNTVRVKSKWTNGNITDVKLRQGFIET